jgi:hypothetical protein
MGSGVYVYGGKKRGVEKRNGEWGLYVWWEKKRSGKERRKKFEKKKTKLILFVCSVCLV